MKGFPTCLLLLLTLARPGLCHAQATAVPTPVDIGINVGGVSDYAVESFFVDAMKQARHWGTPGTPWDQAATVDAQGWPTQDAGAVILCCIADANGKTELAGTYALSFQGSATVNVVAFTGSVTNMSYDAATNMSTAAVTLADSGAGTSMMLSFTNTRRNPGDAAGTGVTNVHLIRPQTAPNGQKWWNSQTQLFTNPFLNLLKPFSTLRFMDFAATNGSPVAHWTQRTTPQSATQQSSNGAAWEYAIQLANSLHKDIWINIPDQADTDYVTELATLMHAELNPNLHIWLEYSNEVWNYSFIQASRNQAAAEAIVAANPKSPLAFDCHDYSNCRYQWGERLVGLRAVQNGEIFRKIYGNRRAMIRPVFATQLGQTYFVSLVFSMLSATMGPPSSYLYAIAQAPYWTGDITLDGLDESQELTNAAANLATMAKPEHDFAVWATDFGLRSVTYEGGPGMSGTPSLDAKIAANRDPAIGPLVAQSLRQAFGSGIGLYMYYNDAGSYSQYGMWGATEDVFARNTPKLAAIADVLADKTEPLAVGSLLPASITASQPDIGMGSGFIASDGSYAYLRAGGIYGYLINVPSAATYEVTLSLGNYGAATTATLLVDRKTAASIVIPNTGGNLQNWTPSSASVTLSAGLHVLSVKATGGEFGMQKVRVK